MNLVCIWNEEKKSNNQNSPSCKARLIKGRKTTSTHRLANVSCQSCIPKHISGIAIDFDLLTNLFISTKKQHWCQMVLSLHHWTAIFFSLLHLKKFNNFFLARKKEYFERNNKVCSEKNEFLICQLKWNWKTIDNQKFWNR